MKATAKDYSDAFSTLQVGDVVTIRNSVTNAKTEAVVEKVTSGRIIAGGIKFRKNGLCADANELKSLVANFQ